MYEMNAIEGTMQCQLGLILVCVSQTIDNINHKQTNKNALTQLALFRLLLEYPLHRDIPNSAVFATTCSVRGSMKMFVPFQCSI